MIKTYTLLWKKTLYSRADRTKLHDRKEIRQKLQEMTSNLVYVPLLSKLQMISPPNLYSVIFLTWAVAE